jgi:hypothetical protein
VAASPSSASFRAFFWKWAQRQRWQVPAIHWQLVDWLEHCHDPVRVLQIFRGAGKSTLYAVYKAWRLYRDRSHRSLVWSEDTKLAKKMTRDVLNILRNHPWCGGIVPPVVGAEEFWVNGAADARNASMAAYGVLSNATGSRADAIDFDDVEVPKNIRTSDAREKLRDRISEAAHILVPGGQKTYIGTPHTHDSIYPEEIAAGAAVLKIPLFARTFRIDDSSKASRFAVPFDAEADGFYVFAGIGKFARLLVDGEDYQTEGRVLVFRAPPAQKLDVYTGCAWPERFTRADLQRRRKDTRTLNAWDSQYMLEAKPMKQVRLDPAQLIPYDVEPVVRVVNRTVLMMLGSKQIVSARLRLDPSSGKPNSDVSALALMLQDADGHLYWHRAIALQGQLAEVSDTGQIEGGQVEQIVDVIEQFELGRIEVETNGIGGHVPSILRGALKRRRVVCGVSEVHTKGNKNARILSAFEPPLSAGYLWAHVSVIDVVEDQMRDWNPAVDDQADDHLDAGAGALAAEPVRIGKAVSADRGVPGRGQMSRTRDGVAPDDWRPNAGVFEVEFER